MTVLVTGATGFLGRRVVERLCAHGETAIRCLVRHNSEVSRLMAIRDQHPEARIECMTGNLLSMHDVRRAVQGVSTIYHLAAGMRGAPATLFMNTVVASKRLREAVRNRPRVVLVSTLGVYDTAPLGRSRVVTEGVGLDPHPEKRNVYFHAKIWQERLFREAAEQGKIELVVVRPGVLYGEGNPSRGFPSRVGISIGKWLLVFGGRNVIPFTHVNNCSEAIVLAGQSADSGGQSYNVCDDDLPTGSQYVRAYHREVKRMRTVRFSYPAAMTLSWAVEKYHALSRGQIPAIVTRYETRAMWKGHRFDNQKIKDLGWKPMISTQEALRETFEYLRSEPVEAVSKTAQRVEAPHPSLQRKIAS